MATDNELFEAFDMLLGAGLDFAPTAEMISKTVNSWRVLLADIPGDLLAQAARDIAISGERFPSVPRLRKAAASVRAHNGTSAAPDAFKPTAEPVTIWTACGAPTVCFPPDVQRKIDVIIERIGDGVMSDAQIEYIDRLTAPYREAA